MKTFTDDTPDVSTAAKVALEVAEADRVTALMLAAATDEPHARVVSALFTALHLMAEAYPCCRPSMAQLAMKSGLNFACVPHTSASAHVH